MRFAPGAVQRVRWELWFLNHRTSCHYQRSTESWHDSQCLQTILRYQHVHSKEPRHPSDYSRHGEFQENPSVTRVLCHCHWRLHGIPLCVAINTNAQMGIARMMIASKWQSRGECRCRFPTAKASDACRWCPAETAGTNGIDACDEPHTRVRYTLRVALDL